MQTIQVSFSEALKESAPQLVCGIIQCRVTNSLPSEELWAEIRLQQTAMRMSMVIPDIKQKSTINATRMAYKRCGKDPNRYRPSAEQLNRRILQNKELYRISTLVDLINLVSLKSGYSIGGFDAEKIEGDLVYGIGQKGEEYCGIGRGLLNIEGLPVIRDDIGGIGTPTSDEERTMLSMDTKELLMNINAFDGDEDALDSTIGWSIQLLKKYTNACDIHISKFK